MKRQSTHIQKSEASKKQSECLRVIHYYKMDKCNFAHNIDTIQSNFQISVWILICLSHYCAELSNVQL